jgi:glucose-1-phosphate thymidylyltransferase
MQVIIPVAGKGTRLRPHTHTLAKPLMHVAGKPVLQHILDTLEGLPITNIIMITGHLSEQFDSLKTKYPIVTVKQEEQLGTAHAINLARPYVKEPVLIVFADTVFDADMSVITKVKADGIIWAKEVEDYQRFGVIVHKDHVMQKIVEKPKEPISKLANIGVYYIHDYNALFEGIDHVFKHDIKTKGEYFLTDALQHMVDTGKKIIVEPVEGWYDCGTWEAFIDTNRVLLAKKSKFKPVEGCTIIPPVWIEDNVTLRESVIGPNVSIASGTHISRSVISDTIIHNDVEISDAILKDSIIAEKAQVQGQEKKVSLGAHASLSL